MFSMYSTLVTIGSVSMDGTVFRQAPLDLVASIFIIGVLAGRALTGYQVNRIGAQKLMYIGTVLFLSLTYYIL